MKPWNIQPVIQTHQYPYGYPGGQGNTADDYRIDRWTAREGRLNQVAANNIINEPAPIGNQTGGMLFARLLLTGWKGNIGPRFDFMDYEAPLSGPYSYKGVAPMNLQPQVQLQPPWNRYKLGKVYGGL